MTQTTVHNAYPELPVLDFMRTAVPLSKIGEHIKQTDALSAVKRAAYVIVNNESGSGKKGVNNNYGGLQADGNRIADKWTKFLAGTCVYPENKTGRLRRFLCFANWASSVDIILEVVQKRGLYVGGFAHPYANMQINSESDWPTAYYREWVEGDADAIPSTKEMKGLIAQYNAAIAAVG